MRCKYDLDSELFFAFRVTIALDSDLASHTRIEQVFQRYSQNSFHNYDKSGNCAFKKTAEAGANRK